MSGHVLSLFGGFDLRDDQGAPITIRSKKGRCLLAYLALAPGRKIQCDVLTELLWGDRGDTQARHSLSQELYRLRGIFPKNAQAGFHPDGGAVGIAAELLDVDVVRFQRGIKAAAPEAIAEAAAIYTGDLMVGLETGQESFDEWLRDERERLRDRALSAWRDLLREQMDGPNEVAIDSAAHLLSLDATNEEAHRALMQLYEKTGRRDLALKQYEKCREILSAELGVEPDASTLELFERISRAPQQATAPIATPSAVESDPGGGQTTGDQTLPLPSKPSIAVLPFDNMSDDAGQEYFSNGVADDIITGLSRFRDLFVISRNSSFSFKGLDVHIKQIGDELGVRYVLKGGVRKAGNRVRINAQLIEVETDNHLWAEKYDGDLNDIFALQDEITERVLGAVQPTVFLAEMDRARRKHPKSLDAYEMCMKGWAYEVRMDKSSLEEARICFQKAIDLDDGIAQAHAGLAGLNFWQATLGWSDNFEHSLDEALRAAQRAVDIDETDAMAHAYVGLVSIFVGRLDSAPAEIDRAIELSPNNSIARVARSWALCYLGRAEEGVGEAELALRFSPRDWFRFSFLHALTLSQYLARDFAGSAETALKLVALKPEYLYGHGILAMACAQSGQTERARTALREALRLNPKLDIAFVRSVSPYQNETDMENVIEGLSKAGLEI